jgi:excisionase family DNA binding protein
LLILYTSLTIQVLQMERPVTLESLSQELLELRSILSKSLTALKETLDLEEAAMYVKQSRSYLYKLTSQNLIPHYKPNGKKIYFKRSELDEWALKNKVYSAYELEQKAVNHLAKGAK